MVKKVFCIFIVAIIIFIASADENTVTGNDRLVFAHVNTRNGQRGSLLLNLSRFTVQNPLNSGVINYAQSESMRHGDRTILKTYPNDPYRDEKFWPEGLGQLTKSGRLRHYKLGKYLRKRYYKLLGNGKYSPNKVYVESSDFDRTIESAAANLAGFFPPEKDEMWNDEIAWRPISIHAIPKHLDHKISVERPCPRLKKALNDVMELPEFLEAIGKVEKYFKVIDENDGIGNGTVFDKFNLWDTLNAEKLTNKTLPPWAEEIMAPNGELTKFIEFSFAFTANTTEIKRLKSGFLIQEMLKHFTAKAVSKLEPDRSLWIYSAHDLTIVNLLSSLGVFEPHVPKYAACVFFELYKSADDYYVQLFYKNSSSNILPALNIAGCGTKCSLDKFYQVFEDIIPTNDFDAECQLPSSSDTTEWDLLSWNIDLIVPFVCSFIILSSKIFGG